MPLGFPTHTWPQLSELRHWAPSQLHPAETELSAHETLIMLCGSQGLLETMTGYPHFFHLVSQWWGCPITIAPSRQFPVVEAPCPSPSWGDTGGNRGRANLF